VGLMDKEYIQSLTTWQKKMLNAGILEEFWGIDFEDYNGKREVKKLVKKYLKNIDNARDKGICLFLHGSNGTGKTFLGIEVLKEAIRNGYSTQFTSLSGVVQTLTDGWYDDKKRRQYEERIRDVDFLMIDDVGKEKRVSKNNLVAMTFDNLIRYRTFRNKPLILTTNSDIKSIKSEYGKSVVSLLLGKFIPVKVYGDDYRKTVLANNVVDRLEN
jgi:DNA replication protein DnaC